MEAQGGLDWLCCNNTHLMIVTRSPTTATYQLIRPHSCATVTVPLPVCSRRFITGDTPTRNLMLKLIPHIADGSWVVKNSVGTKPVITGKVGGNVKRIGGTKGQMGSSTKTVRSGQ